MELELFDLHFQGVYRTEDRALSHLEVLIRMRDPNVHEQLILPGQFIHLAEKSGQVLDIDRWVLKRSIALLGQHAHLPPLAVNLSGLTFGDPGLPQFIQRLLSEHAVDPRRLFVELTETAAVSDLQDAQRFIEAIQWVGCGVCLDDFGSGFCTFAYLKYPTRHSRNQKGNPQPPHPAFILWHWRICKILKNGGLQEEAVEFLW